MIWYRRYSDKYLEQGTRYTLTSAESSAGGLKNLVKSYTNTSYNLLVSNCHSVVSERRSSSGFVVSKSQVRVMSSAGTNYSGTAGYYMCYGY